MDDLDDRTSMVSTPSNTLNVMLECKENALAKAQKPSLMDYLWRGSVGAVGVAAVGAVFLGAVHLGISMVHRPELMDKLDRTTKKVFNIPIPVQELG